MNLAEIIEFINKNVTSPSQLEGMRGMGLSLEPLPESYRAKKETTDNGIDYYICNRNVETRNKLVEKLKSKVGETGIKENGWSNQHINREEKVNIIHEQQIEKKCNECGAIISEDALFCHKCGTKYVELQQDNIGDDWEFDFEGQASEFVLGGCLEKESVKDMGDNIGNPDLVAENALLTPCPDTECTHGKECYKTEHYASLHYKSALYNGRLFYIKQVGGRSQASIWCCKEDESEKFCLIENVDVDSIEEYHIVVNYHGIYIYNLSLWDGPEKGRFGLFKTNLLWYDFSGNIKKKINLATNCELLDVYIYGAKIFFATVSKTEGDEYSYHAKYWDLLSDVKRSIPIQTGKAITRILGNNDFMLFHIEKESRVYSNDSSDIKYDAKTGWCISWHDENITTFCKTAFYPQNAMISDIYDECELPQIEFFDLKRNLIWVDSRKENEKNCTMLISYKILKGKVEISLEQKWYYPLLKRERYRYDQYTQWYFDGNRMYIGDYYDSKFYAYSCDGKQYIWQAKRFRYFAMLELFRVLGDYLYISEDKFCQQYYAVLEQSEIQRGEFYDMELLRPN